jgi:hypothetical protein
VCKVLVALGLFLGLDNEDIEQQMREGGERLAYKMNLQGWQSDRPNLYFRFCEDKKKYRDAGTIRQRKSMEGAALRPSLAMSDDGDYRDDPTSIMSDEEEDEQRDSLLLVWS